MKTYSRNKPTVYQRSAVTFDDIIPDKRKNEGPQRKGKNKRQFKKPQPKKVNSSSETICRKRKGSQETYTAKHPNISAQNSDSESSIEVLRDVAVDVNYGEIGQQVSNIYKELLKSSRSGKSVVSSLQKIAGSPVEICPSTTDLSTSTNSEDVYTYTWATETEIDVGGSAVPSTLREVTPCFENLSQPIISDHETKDGVSEFLSSTAKLPAWKQSKRTTFPVDMSPIIMPQEFDISGGNARELNEKTPNRKTDPNKTQLRGKALIKSMRSDVRKPCNSTVLFKSCFVDIANVVPDLSSIHQCSDITGNERKLKEETIQKFGNKENEKLMCVDVSDGTPEKDTVAAPVQEKTISEDSPVIFKSLLKHRLQSCSKRNESSLKGKRHLSFQQNSSCCYDSSPKSEKRKKASSVMKNKEYAPFNLCFLLSKELPKKHKVARSQYVECSSAFDSKKTVPNCSLCSFVFK